MSGTQDPKPDTQQVEPHPTPWRVIKVKRTGIAFIASPGSAPMHYEYRVRDAKGNEVLPMAKGMEARYTCIVTAMNACAGIASINVDRIKKTQDKLRPAILMCGLLGLDYEAKFLANISSIGYMVNHVMFTIRGIDKRTYFNSEASNEDC